MDIAEGGCESECAGKVGVRGNKSYKGIASGHKDASWVVEVKYKALLLNVPGWEVRRRFGTSLQFESDEILMWVRTRASLIKSRPMVPRASANYTRTDQ